MHKPETAPAYVTEAVRRGDIENSVLANGMLQASKLVSVGARVSGQILRIAAGTGDEVKKGDLIAQIDSLAQQNNLKDALASLKDINAQFRAKQAQIRKLSWNLAASSKCLPIRPSSRADYEVADANLTVYQPSLSN